MARSKIKKASSLEKYKPHAVVKEDAESFMNARPSWRFKNMDMTGEWSLNLAEEKEREKVFSRLSNFEKMTWREIFKDCNNENHMIDPSDLTKKAQDRMNELKRYEDRIVSLRIEAQKRIYGFMYGSVCEIIWYDNKHGDTDECVCRSRKKHT